MHHRPVQRQRPAARRPLASLLLALAACAALVGCQRAAPKMLSPDQPNTYLYDYTAWDKQGRVVARGLISMRYDDPRNGHGVWEIQPVNNPQRIGPQTGNGNLTVRKDAGQIVINLNPEKPTRNVLLTGSNLGSTIDGAWQWQSVSSILNQGKFRAERRMTSVE